MAKGALSADPLQARAAKTLDRIAAELGSREAARGLLSGLLKKPGPIRGAYLVGEVGRGKTMLMDLFFAQVADRGKAPRAFPRVHGRGACGDRQRSASRRRAKADNADPVAAVIKPVLNGVRLLCLDEFQVTDITNAMLLGRLFEKLFAGGVMVVATSNVRARRALRERAQPPAVPAVHRAAEAARRDRRRSTGRPTTGG